MSKELRSFTREPVVGEHVGRMVLAPGTTMGENVRAERIVLLAAKKVGVKSAADWLRKDENLTWHKFAKSKLEETREKAASLGMTEGEVDSGIASLLQLRALEAIQSVSKRGRR